MKTSAANNNAQRINAELREMLRAAQERFLRERGLVRKGAPVFGWRDRSVGSAVDNAGELQWLRVVWARKEWARGSWWTGNQDADVIRAAAKSRVLEVSELEEGPLTYRFELMTYQPGRPCSPTPDLRAPLGVEVGWWDALEESLGAVARTITPRKAVDDVAIVRRIRVFFGVETSTDVGQWRASHGDLHWANLHAEPFSIVDWEAWGLAPRGYDAAFLLCHSLAVPDTADEIARRFAQDLATDEGIVSQLYVMTKMLTRADGGEFPELVAPIHRHADRLLGRTPFTRPSSEGEAP